MITIFNTRELAIIFWGLVILVIFLSFLIKGNGFKSLFYLFISFFKLFKHLAFSVSLIYLVVLFFIFYRIGLIRELDLIKDYLKLVLFVIIPLIPNVIENYLKVSMFELMISFFKVSTIFLFIINEYTFNFLMELLIVLICFIIIFILGAIDKQNEYAKWKQVLNNILGIVFLLVIAGAVYKFYLNIEDIKKIIFWKKMFIEILVVSHLPLFFFLKYSMYYEQILTKIKIKTTLADTPFGKIKTLYILIKYLKFNEERLKHSLETVFNKELYSYNDLQFFLRCSVLN